jgi:hypothetical protein
MMGDGRTKSDGLGIVSVLREIGKFLSSSEQDGRERG